MYRLLYNPDLYLRAYAKVNSNTGAMTPGATPETVDGMSLEKIKAIIEALRSERYRWTPVRRTYTTKFSKQSFCQGQTVQILGMRSLARARSGRSRYLRKY